MSGIFISYRREDSASAAGRLYDRLAARFGSGRVFRDIYGMKPGAHFPDAINQMIASTDVLLAVIGRRWTEVRDGVGRRRLDDPKDWVGLEIATALERGVVVIPVLVEDARLPSADELPIRLQGMTRRHAIELSDERWDYDVRRLIGVLEEYVGPHTRPVARMPAASRPSRFTQYRVPIALGFVIVLLAITLVIVTALRPDTSSPSAVGGTDSTGITSSQTTSGAGRGPSPTPAQPTPSTTRRTPLAPDPPPVLRAVTADLTAGTVTVTFDQPVKLGSGSLAALQLVIYTTASCSTPAGNGQHVLSGSGTATLTLRATSLSRPTSYIKIAEGFVVSMNSATPNEPVDCRGVATR